MTTAAVTPVPGPVTEEEFLARYGPDDRVELVDGEVIPKYGTDGPMSPTSNAHGRIVMDLIRALDRVVHPGGLGEIFTDPACFVISETPKRMRCPDVAFVRAGRIPEEIALDGIVRLAPDLVAEVISRSEPASQVDAKIDQYLEAGVRLVWKIDPRRRVVTTFHAGGAVTRLAESDVLDGGDVVPGFRLPVAELFARVARR